MIACVILKHARIPFRFVEVECVVCDGSEDMDMEGDYGHTFIGRIRI